MTPTARGTRLAAAFDYVVARAKKKLHWLKGAKLRFCRLADADHRRKWRQFMHSNEKKMTVCVAKAAETEMTDAELVGMMAHELGHIVGAELEFPEHMKSHRGPETPKAVQTEADWIARNVLGFKIKCNERTLQESEAPAGLPGRPASKARRNPEEESRSLPTLQRRHLVVTRFMTLAAADNKASVWIPINPVNFLRLTTTDDVHMEKIFSSSRPLDDYNTWSLNGEMGLAPTLRVERDSGKVVSHEGRHRAAALLKADPDARMWVSIVLTGEHGGHNYDLIPGKGFEKRFLGPEDVPTVLRGEFRSTRVSIPRSEMVPIWDEEGNRVVR